jgi:phage shock protein A
MSIFTRVRDIVSSNINAMLEKAEDPEKLVKMMIREMEDTLVEIKASCAGAMANTKKIQRDLELVEGRADEWANRAQLAVDKGRDDLAREALIEKKRYLERAEGLRQEAEHCGELVKQYQGDIVQLEEKLAAARDKQRGLAQQHRRAVGKKRTQQHIRTLDTSDAMERIDRFENKIDRIDAEADLENFGRKPNLEDEFAQLEGGKEIDAELEALKAKKNQ